MILESGEPGAAIGIRPDGDAGRVLTCTSSCALALPPGAYRVSVSRAGESSWRRVWIYEPQRLIVTPPDPGSRDLGAGLALSGLVIGGVGSALMAYGMVTALPCAYGEPADRDSEGSGESSCTGPTFMLIGLAGMATGLAVGIPGLVLLVKHSHPRVNVEPYAAKTAQPGGLSVGVGNGRTPAGLSFGVRF